MKRKILCCLLACLMCFSLCSCGTSEEEQSEADAESQVISQVPKKTVLRVLVDKLPNRSSYTLDGRGFRTQLDLQLIDFHEKHRDVDVVIEQVPDIKADREIFIKNLNAELLAGNGPDVMLLRNEFTAKEIIGSKEPLFDDVNLLMRNGIFYDLSEFYEADEELNAEGLRKEVMDAGVVDGARYVLPLRYDFPVVYVDGEKFDKTGLSRDIFTGTIFDYLNGAAGVKGEWTTYNFEIRELYHQLFNFMPELIDYNTGKVILPEENAVKFFEAYKKYDKTQRDYRTPYTLTLSEQLGFTFRDYRMSGEYHWMNSDTSFIYTHSLLSAMENIVIAKGNGYKLEMYPLRGIDGSVTANVTYYGAISAGCKNPELAYEFLREWLTEEYQWDQNMTNTGNPYYQTAQGWPVRTAGSGPAIAKSMYPRNYLHRDKGPSNSRPMDMTFLNSMTDSDFSILDTKIDVVRFDIPKIEKIFVKELMMGYNSNYDTPTDMAKALIKTLQTHLDEG